MGIIQLLTNNLSINEGSGKVNVPVIRYGDFGNRTLIKYTTILGSALDGLDYVGNLAGSLTFQPGESLKTIQVSIINDAVAELDETFSVAIGDAVNLYTVPGKTPDEAGAPRTAIVTIKDNEVGGGGVQFSEANFTINENLAVAQVVLTKQATSTPATVSFKTEDDYAKSVTTRPEFRDYTAVNRSITFAPQQTRVTVTIPIVNDNLSELNERFNLILSNPVNTTLGLRNTATVTINNDDSIPGIFTKEQVVTGLTRPSGFAWGNNGYMYITETDGKVLVFDEKNKTLLPTPFLNMTDKVNNRGQRGLLSFAIDPQFPAKPYLYLGYTYDSPQEVAKDGLDSDNKRTNRLVRVTADPKTNFTTALPNSEVVLMEVANGANFHASAGLTFGKDGSLFWAHGDGAVVASVIVDPAKFNDLNYPFGKLYRINPTTGKAYTDNPFYDPQKPDSYRSKVYSYGLRNPFRITINPKTGEPYIGDVGWDNWEEVNTGRGKNFGWPLYEGANGISTRTPAYANEPDLQDLYNSINVTAPIYARNHKDGFYSMTVGDFYDSNVYPSILKDSLFVSNFNGGYIEALNFDTTGTKVENSILFDSTTTILPTQMTIGPDGLLYVANYQFFGVGTASIVRWAYDKALPKISIADVTVVEGNTGNTPANFVLSLDTKFSQPVKVNYSIASDTASAGSDVVAVFGTFTMAPGTTLGTIQVPVKADVFVENDETFFLKLSAPVNGILNKTSAVGTILNDDGGVTPPKISISDRSVTEGNTGSSTASFIVSLNTPGTQSITVNYTTANQTALSPSDYQATSGILTFTTGATSRTISVAVKGDTLIEPNETFFVNLSNPSNATVIKNIGIGTIINNDIPVNLPQITISDAYIREGNTGTTTARFVVRINKPGTQALRVNYTTANQTAQSPGDYVANTGQITFAPGILSRTIEVAVKGDTLVEGNESFLVNLTNPVNGVIIKNAAVATIFNDDSLTMLLDKNVTITEGQSGLKFADFVVNLSSPSVNSVVANLSTSNGSATAGIDYTATTSAILFSPGTTTATFKVPIIGDQLFEPNENFWVRLSNPSAGTITRAQVQGLIINDDLKPQISVSDATVVEGNSGTTIARFILRLSASSSQGISFIASTTSGSAVSPTDYVSKNEFFFFAPGQTLKTFSVQVKGDTTSESNETFTVNLTNLSNVEVGDITGVGTIVNDDLTKAKGLGGSAERFKIHNSTLTPNQEANLIASDYSNTASSEKVIIKGLTQSDVFAANVDTTNLGI